MLVAPTYSRAILLPSELPGSNHEVGDRVLVPDGLCDGDRLTEGAAEAEQHRGSDPGRGVGEDDRADRLPARRPERERAVLELLRDPYEELPADRRRDGNDHDREHERRGEDPRRTGAPEKTGMKPRTSPIHGSRCSATQGPKTMMPQRPSTTLGIAASSSTTVAIGAATRRGAISVRKSAIAMDSGVARIRAIAAVTTVP